MTTIQTADLHCQSCGKKISYAQAVMWQGKHYCLDSIINLLARQCEDERVSVSVDLLERLRDGVLYRPMGIRLTG